MVDCIFCLSIIHTYSSTIEIVLCVCDPATWGTHDRAEKLLIDVVGRQDGDTWACDQPMIKWPSCQPCCVWICTSPGLWLQMLSIPAPESESSVCLRHTEVALDSWRNQSVQCSASDLHAQQTSSVHHSGSALKMLTSRKKEASPSKALLATYT